MIPHCPGKDLLLITKMLSKWSPQVVHRFVFQSLVTICMIKPCKEPSFKAHVSKTKDFEKYLNQMADNYQGNHMLVPMGCDFTFANARLNFENMDRLIQYFNEHNTANITLMYSTPGKYLDSLHA
jgi:hypothetical protein